jgi:hypothetical protein
MVSQPRVGARGQLLRAAGIRRPGPRSTLRVERHPLPALRESPAASIPSVTLVAWKENPRRTVALELRYRADVRGCLVDKPGICVPRSAHGAP